MKKLISKEYKQELITMLEKMMRNMWLWVARI